MEKQWTYPATLQFLYEQLPMFSRTGKDAIKKDLTNIRKLCEVLGNPQEKFKTIHIAGTNGKGSTSHTLAAVLQNSGYKTGLYTSPHLIDFRERFRIDGRLVNEEWVVSFVENNLGLIERVQPSFFEITVAMAFQAFADAQVDVAVIETGLGGRLDSTNIITPLLSIITNISYDHQDMLGATLKEIAGEKAGIIKPCIPVVIGEEHAETERVFLEAAMRNNSKLYYAQPIWDLVKTKQDAAHQYFKVIHRAKRMMYDLKTDLLGNYQQHNIRTVLAAVEVLDTTADLKINIKDALEALANVKSLTGLQGRWEVWQTQPLVIADVAHNLAGIREMITQWGQVTAKNKKIIVGFVKDKDVRHALSLFPKEGNTYYFCNADIPRALPAEELHRLAMETGLAGQHYPSVKTALEAALNDGNDDTAVLITGSFFIVGEAMEAFAKNEMA